MIASLLYIQWLYATNNYRLVDENLDLYIKNTVSRRLLFGIIIYLIAIGFSFVYVQLSVFIFTMILIPSLLPNKMIHRITFGGGSMKK